MLSQALVAQKGHISVAEVQTTGKACENMITSTYCSSQEAWVYSWQVWKTNLFLNKAV